MEGKRRCEACMKRNRERTLALYKRNQQEALANGQRWMRRTI